MGFSFKRYFHKLQVSQHGMSYMSYPRDEALCVVLLGLLVMVVMIIDYKFQHVFVIHHHNEPFIDFALKKFKRGEKLKPLKH